jgi:hypothetical protein
LHEATFFSDASHRSSGWDSPLSVDLTASTFLLNSGMPNLLSLGLKPLLLSYIRSHLLQELKAARISLFQTVRTKRTRMSLAQGPQPLLT